MLSCKDLLSQASFKQFKNYVTANLSNKLNLVDYNDAHRNDGYSHNCIFRGKDLTEYFDSGQMSADMANGNFSNIYIGDYIVKTIITPETTYTAKNDQSRTIATATYSNIKFRVAGINYHLHSGDTETTRPHVVLIAENTLQRNINMNPTNDTTGAYVGSDMWTKIIPMWVTAIEEAFGSNHVLSHRELLSNAITSTAASAAGAGWTGSSSSWGWYTVKVNIPNEVMIYGTAVFSSSGFDVGDCCRILPLFAMTNNNPFGNRSWFWLRSVVSSSRFASANGHGNAISYDASSSSSNGGVRPYFLLI